MNSKSGKGSLAISEVMELISCCAKNKVLELRLGDLSVIFGDDSAEPQAMPVPPLGTPEEVKALDENARRELDEQVETEYMANLLASNPKAYEDYQLQLLRDQEDAAVPREELEGNV